MAKHSTKVEISFLGEKLNVDKVNIRSKDLQADLKQKRNTIARYLSDFISEEIGLGRKLTSSQAKLFGNEDAAPDAIINIEQFTKLTGAIPAESALGVKEGFTFFETKVSGLGKSSDIQLTQTAISRLDDKNQPNAQFTAVQSILASTNKKEITGKAAIDLLFTPAFSNIKDNLLRNTIEKMENLLIVSIAEKERTPVISYKFVPSPLPANSLADKAVFSQNYYVRIRPRYDNGVAVAYRVDISPNSALQNKIKNSAVDITKQVQSLHSKGISIKLINYLKKRISTKTGGSTGKELNDYLALAHAMANDFKVGGHTPFVLETRIQVPGTSMSSATLNITGKSKKVRTVNKPTPQKFISSAQWTYLVQKRLGDSMLSFGEPEPPDIKERSGRFRRSVDVTANYRTKTIQYNYNPLYRSLEHYGYHPELQVERSIRQVAQDLYAREFSIIRRGTLA